MREMSSTGWPGNISRSFVTSAERPNESLAECFGWSTGTGVSLGTPPIEAAPLYIQNDWINPILISTFLELFKVVQKALVAEQQLDGDVNPLVRVVQSFAGLGHEWRCVIK